MVQGTGEGQVQGAARDDAPMGGPVAVGPAPQLRNDERAIQYGGQRERLSNLWGTSQHKIVSIVWPAQMAFLALAQKAKLQMAISTECAQTQTKQGSKVELVLHMTV